MDMEYFKNFNLSIGQQRQIIVWLSGLYGLLLGIISMFLVELRLGIESWFQLLVILLLVPAFVFVCNTIVIRILHKKPHDLDIGSGFWFSVLSVFLLLIISAVSLAVMI